MCCSRSTQCLPLPKNIGTLLLCTIFKSIIARGRGRNHHGPSGSPYQLRQTELETSNLLINNRGIVKVADFGLGRRFGDPIGVGGMTQLVVTLWYRSVTCAISTSYSLIFPPQSSRNLARGRGILDPCRPMIGRMHFCGTSSQSTCFKPVMRLK